MEPSTEYTKPDIDIASDSMEKGLVRGDKQLIAWDSIQECDLDRCPLRHKCVQKTEHGEKCAVQIAYLSHLTNTIFSTYRYLDEASLFKVGMHLIPLYSQLCRQKIVEKSVGSLAYEDAKGVTRIHPIYKEMRETMKCIALFWREMGFPVLSPDLPLGAAGLQSGKTGFGDPTHYATISQNADNKRDVIR